MTILDSGLHFLGHPVDVILIVCKAEYLQKKIGEWPIARPPWSEALRGPKAHHISVTVIFNRGRPAMFRTKRWAGRRLRQSKRISFCNSVTVP